MSKPFVDASVYKYLTEGQNAGNEDENIPVDGLQRGLPVQYEADIPFFIPSDGEEQQRYAGKYGNGGHIKKIRQCRQSQFCSQRLPQAPEEKGRRQNRERGLFTERDRSEGLQPVADDVEEKLEASAGHLRRKKSQQKKTMAISQAMHRTIPRADHSQNWTW